MDLTAHFAPLSEIQADWLIVGVWEDESFPGALAQLDAHLAGSLARLQQASDITGKANELTTLLGHGGAAERLVVVGLGKRSTADRARLSDAAAVAARAVTGKQRQRIACAVP